MLQPRARWTVRGCVRRGVGQGQGMVFGGRADCLAEEELGQADDGVCEEAQVHVAYEHQIVQHRNRASQVSVLAPRKLFADAPLDVQPDLCELVGVGQCVDSHALQFARIQLAGVRISGKDVLYESLVPVRYPQPRYAPPRHSVPALSDPTFTQDCCASLSSLAETTS